MKAYFAGGCFWCITPIYKAYGVERVVCGFSGGEEVSPTYEEVKAQQTGHRETVELHYDPAVVPYSRLIDVFLANVDPFDDGGQFIDRGRSYTLAVYYQTEYEKNLACEKIAEIEKAGGKRAYIAVEPFRSFYPAGEEHQDFYLKEPERFAREIEESGRKPL